MNTITLTPMLIGGAVVVELIVILISFFLGVCYGKTDLTRARITDDKANWDDDPDWIEDEE